MTAKRALDVAGAATLLALTWPLWLAAALAVRLDSPGPVLYRAERVGKDGRLFRMYKFRTMRHGVSGPDITTRNDARITRSGRLLRRSKLDELPQLFNVLKGDMSLVGPRPEAPAYVRWDDELQRTVLTVQPGITGPSQLQYWNEEAALAPETLDWEYALVQERKLALDAAYARQPSVRQDIRWLLRTAGRLGQELQGFQWR